MAKSPSVWSLLATSANTLPELERRRANLLASLLTVTIFLDIAALILVLIVGEPGSARQTEYIGLIVALLCILLLAYGLNHLGQYYLSAGLTITCAILGPWGSFLLDPTIFEGNFVPLTYVVIPVLLSSILLHPLVTISLAFLQMTLVALVAWSSPVPTPISWPSFLAFIFFTSVFSILANIISQRDLAQIDRQIRQLALREAQLRELSIRDHLTNLFNRRYMEETLEREVERARRKKGSLGVIMLDIDNFKNMNDTLGHAAGDVLFQELGTLLNSQVRSADIACRYGGDEFVLILPEASQDVTLERAEHLREKVKHLHVEYEGCMLEAITVSLGVAVFPDHGSTGEALLRSADDALYRAKYEGRDRVIMADFDQ